MTWLVAWMAVTAAHADPRAEKICDDIFNVYDQAQSSVADVEAYIRKDPRQYDDDVIACLCKWGAHVTIQQAARRHAIRDRVTEGQTAFEIATRDPISDPSAQVAAAFSRHLEQVLGEPVPFVLHPTFASTPRWFELYGFQTILGGLEVPGSAAFGGKAWETYVGGRPPTGRLAELRASGALVDNADLEYLSQAFDRVLWVDVEGEETGGPLTLSWSMQELKATPPHPELGQQTLTFNPMNRPLVGSCIQPDAMAATASRGRRLWPAGRIATATASSALALASLGASVAAFLQYQDREAAVGDEGRRWEDLTQAEQDEVLAYQRSNIGFGVAAIAGGAVATVAFALPGRYWR